MKKPTLHEILEAASREVRSWPEWMQRPENRVREPAGNRPEPEPPTKKPRKKIK